MQIKMEQKAKQLLLASMAAVAACSTAQTVPADKSASDAQATAQVKGRERYEGFIEALGRRLEKSKACFSRFQTTSQEAQCRKRQRTVSRAFFG